MRRSTVDSRARKAKPYNVDDRAGCLHSGWRILIWNLAAPSCVEYSVSSKFVGGFHFLNHFLIWMT